MKGDEEVSQANLSKLWPFIASQFPNRETLHSIMIFG